MKRRRRLEVDLIGEFTNLEHQGETTDVYNFIDRVIGKLQVGVYNNVKVELNKEIKVRATIFTKHNYNETTGREYFNTYLFTKEPYETMELPTNTNKEENTQ